MALEVKTMVTVGEKNMLEGTISGVLMFSLLIWELVTQIRSVCDNSPSYMFMMFVIFQ